MAAAPKTPVTDDDELPGEAPPPAPKPKARPVEPEPEPAPQKHQHSTKLTRLALSLGYTQDDLDTYPSEAIWEDIERLRAAESPKPAAVPAAVVPDPVDPDEATLAELERDYPAVGKLLRKALAKGGELSEDVRKKLDKIDVLEAAEQKRQARTMERMIDNAFAALPEEYHPLVGTGPFGELTDPGARGWRGAIYQAAQLLPTDGQKAVAAKVAAAAPAVCGSRVQKKPPGNAYDAAPTKTPARRDANGRYTVEDFEAGAIHRPNGQATGIEQLSAVEKTRRLLKEQGDPRGNYPAIDIDEDLPE